MKAGRKVSVRRPVRRRATGSRRIVPVMRAAERPEPAPSRTGTAMRRRPDSRRLSTRGIARSPLADWRQDRRGRQAAPADRKATRQFQPRTEQVKPHTGYPDTAGDRRREVSQLVDQCRKPQKKQCRGACAFLRRRSRPYCRPPTSRSAAGLTRRRKCLFRIVLFFSIAEPPCLRHLDFGHLPRRTVSMQRCS